MAGTCSLAGTFGTTPGPWAPVGPRRRATGVLAVGLLLLLVVQGWAPQLLDRPPDALPAPRDAAGIDVDSVVEQATHQVRQGPGGGLVVDGDGYRARFGATGLSYRPDGSDAALGISLTDIERGGAALPIATGVWRPDANIVERRLSPTISERVTSRSGEVEWDVVLDAPPAGRGELTVAARLTGTTGTPVRDDHAWRVRLADGEDVRIGEVVVKDATGAAVFRGLPEIGDGRIELVVPDAVLRTAGYPLTVDPTVGAAKRVTGPGKRASSDIAFDGTRYLVVWEDERGATGTDIRAARVRASDNQVLDPNGIVIANDARAESDPAVAWNGTVFLVVWALQFSADDEDVLAQRIRTDGTKAGSNLIVAGNGFRQQDPDVASNGSSFQVVWSDNTEVGVGGAFQIWGSRITGNGTKLDGIDGRRIIQSGFHLTNPALAWNQSAGAYLVAYEVAVDIGQTDLDSARIIDGFGADPVAHLGSTGAEFEPSVASDDTNWLVAWSRGGAGGGVRVRRVTTGGPPFGTTTRLGAAESDQPDVAFNGVWFVAWQEQAGGGPDLMAARVDSGGGLPDGAEGFPVAGGSGAQVDAAVARGASGGVGVAYTTGNDPSASIDFRSVTPK